MPPRKPGGKYKGLVGRAKSEATMAAEARARAMKAQLEALAKVANAKQKALLAQQGLASSKEEEEEAKRQKIMAHLSGGKKGQSRKAFKAWIMGIQISRKDRLIADRERRWRMCCGCVQLEGFNRRPVCESCNAHTDSAFEMPFDIFLKTGQKTAGSSYLPTGTGMRRDFGLTHSYSAGALGGGSQFGLTDSFNQTQFPLTHQQGLGPPPTQTMPFGQQGPMTQSMGNFAGSTNALMNSVGQGTLPSIPGRTPKGRSYNPDFLQGRLEVVPHYKNGRRCLLDSTNMRIRYEDEDSNRRKVADPLNADWNLLAPNSPLKTGATFSKMFRASKNAADDAPSKRGSKDRRGSLLGASSALANVADMAGSFDTAGFQTEESCI
eukprot:TRINITY_DN4125_c1_g1_i1.p1 TRINITY_DN4125_c1_g1~~TRINITY_DN4125_c1_g1_i1.p1  ORF type:complete len:379 (+),score=51.00 TRINITY_DN4125_c1_g1_i1:185-1321(+)